ncbi:MAG: cell division protein FtsA [Aestuariivita sp.]|nr:cell division protein FtsA [Aestuariivita sp.]
MEEAVRELYENQRAMRQIRKQALHRGVLAILDFGSSKVSCLILQFGSPSSFQQDLGHGYFDGLADFRVIGVGTTQSLGVKCGEITSMNEAERAIRNVLQRAQKMASQRVDHAMVCFSGAKQRSYATSGRIEIEGKTVSEREISRVLAACELPNFDVDCNVLHAQPVNFGLDHRSNLSDPREQYGHELSVDMHMLTVDTKLVQSLIQCINRCDVEVAGLVSSAYASGISTLVEDEQELGAACIDLGGDTTGVSIFLRKHMIHADYVEIGGQNITYDISLGFNIPKSKAEYIKTMHGGVIATAGDDHTIIDIGSDRSEWDFDRRNVSRSELIGVIRPRVEEIFEEIRTRLDDAAFDHLPSRQIVLTGGGSQIPGLDRVAGRILQQQVRLGRPLRIPGLPQAVSGPGFSSVVGLGLFSALPQDEWWDFEMPTAIRSKVGLRRAVQWFRDNW